MREISLKDIIYEKIKLKYEIGGKLSYEDRIKAERDWHAKRPPRPCGLTLHSAVGCPFRCAYCYIQDMGFNFSSIKPYGLRGLELAYSLLVNPYFIPGLHGTYIAIGSISEPFHKVAVDRTLEYIHTISKYLGNPLQFSSKAYISEELIKRLVSITKVISPLITIVTFKLSDKLEPLAPSPQRRLDSLRNLRKGGLKPALFYRPIIPGVNDELEEAERIFRSAKEAGAVAVVLGGLRLTATIVRRLSNLNLDLSKVLSRVKGEIKGSKQVSVNLSDLKENLINVAREVGLIPLKAACCATTLSLYLTEGIKIPCFGLCYSKDNLCTKCPVNCWKYLPKVDLNEVKEYFRRYLSNGLREVNVKDFTIEIEVNNKKSKNRILRKRSYLKIIETIYRREVKVKVH